MNSWIHSFDGHLLSTYYESGLGPGDTAMNEKYPCPRGADIIAGETHTIKKI